jgi:membrane protease YdiL (CAAX protease family)
VVDFRDEAAPVVPVAPDAPPAAPDANVAPAASAAHERTGGRVARAIFVSVYLASFFVGAVVFAVTGGIDPVVATWANLAIVVVFAAVGSWVYRDTWVRSFRLTRERPWVTFGLFVAGLVSIFVLPTIVSLVVLLLGGSPTGVNQAQLVAALGGADTWWVIALAAVVFGPIVEELVFREALAWRLRHRLPAWLLIVGSSLLFGLWHLKDVADLVSVLVYASMGLVLAGTMWLTRGNLLVAVLVHSLRNLASVVLLLALAA